MALLSLTLAKVPNVEGIYGAAGTYFPSSAALLHPDAADGFARACVEIGRLRVSDMLRTAEQSLLARATKTGVQPPGFSAHNFGLAIDIDVSAMLARTGLSKAAFDARMAGVGWWCHRKDDAPAAEWWHYNWLGPEPLARPFLAASARSANTGSAVEAKISQLYGPSFTLSDRGVQEALGVLRLYRGEMDGRLGPRSREAIAAFQRAWGLEATGVADARTQRTLATVSAELYISR